MTHFTDESSPAAARFLLIALLVMLTALVASRAKHGTEVPTAAADPTVYSCIDGWLHERAADGEWVPTQRTHTRVKLNGVRCSPLRAIQE